MRKTTKIFALIATLAFGLTLSSNANAGGRHHNGLGVDVVITGPSIGYEAPYYERERVHTVQGRGNAYAYGRPAHVDKKVRKMKRKKAKKMRRMRRINERYYDDRPVYIPPARTSVPVYDRPVIVIPVPFLR